MSGLNGTSTLQKVANGMETRWQAKDREKREKQKCKLAVCAIIKQLSGGQGVQTIGTGSLVRNLFPDLERKIHLITSEVVISSNKDNLNGYCLCFKKSDSTDKEPLELACVVNTKDKFLFTYGLAIIPLDPSKLGKFGRLRSGLVNHRPFEVGKIQDQSCDLYCHVVEEDRTSHVVRPYKVDNVNGQYSLCTESHLEFKTFREFCGQSTRKPRGAPITTSVDGMAVAVGVITFRNDQICPVFFSQVNGGLTSSDKVTASTSQEKEERGDSFRKIDERFTNLHPKQDADLTALKTKSMEVRGKGPGEMRDCEKCLSKNAAALGYQIRAVNIPEDGNCLYHAVEDQLTVLGQTDIDHTYKSLRKLAVQELKDNLDDHHLSIDLAAVLTDKDPLKYIEEMSLDGRWGGHIELVALAHALQRPIKVVTSLSVSKPEEAIQTIGNSSASPILLGHLHGYHYLSLEALPSQKYDGKGSVKAPAEASLSRSSYSVVTGRNKHIRPQRLGIVPKHHDEESGNPSQNYDDTKCSNEVSFPQKEVQEEYQQNTSFLTTLCRKTCEENERLRTKSELDEKKISSLHEQNLELRSHVRTIEEENEELRTENEMLKEKAERLRAEKEASLTVNKELHNTIKEVINQNSRAVFEDDSCIGSNKEEEEELPGSSANSGQRGKLNVFP